jgi:outer membrane lipoprotein SlyB
MKLRNTLFVTALVCFLGGCASSGDRYGSRDEVPSADGTSAPEPGNDARAAPCSSCGVVERIDVTRQGGSGTTGAGAVAGALVGTASGEQAGRSAAGADAAARPERVRQVFTVTVRMDDGRTQVIEQRALQGVREGARVVVRGDSVQLM